MWREGSPSGRVRSGFGLAEARVPPCAPVQVGAFSGLLTRANYGDGVRHGSQTARGPRGTRPSAPSFGRGLLAAAMGLLGVFGAADALAASPFLEVPLREEAEQTPAYRYANMTNEEAFAELDRRGILYSKLGSVTGVRAPIRLTGRLHGVLIRSSLPPEQRASTPFEILDARLALALDDFAVLLAKHDVEELIHYTMYRPNVPVLSAAAPAAPTQAAPAAAPGKSAAAAPSEAKASPAAKPDGRRASASRGGSAKRRASVDGKAVKSDKPRPAAPSSKNKSGADEAPELERAAELEEAALHGAAHADCDHDHGELDALPLDVSELAAKAARPAKRATPKPGATSAKPAAPSRAPNVGATGAAPTRPAQKLRAAALLDEKPHGKWAPPGTRHPAGLAIDVGALIKRDGSVLSVASHFRGKIGERTCGQGAPVPETAGARELREIVCGAREAGVFTYALTPNYDAPHADHFHLEIKPGVAWFLYH